MNVTISNNNVGVRDFFGMPRSFVCHFRIAISVWNANRIAVLDKTVISTEEGVVLCYTFLFKRNNTHAHTYAKFLLVHLIIQELKEKRNGSKNNEKQKWKNWSDCIWDILFLSEKYFAPGKREFFSMECTMSDVYFTYIFLRWKMYVGEVCGITVRYHWKIFVMLFI